MANYSAIIFQNRRKKGNFIKYSAIIYQMCQKFRLWNKQFFSYSIPTKFLKTSSAYDKYCRLSL